MTLAQGFAAGALLLGLVYVLVASALSLRAAFTMPVLRDLRPREPARWPSLSVVTPACNEGATIEDALRSRLAQGYLELDTDADVHFAPETLRRAVAYCEERGLDFLTAMPEFQPVSLLLDAAVSAFVRNVSMAAHTRAVKDPTSRLAVGAASSTWCAARPSRRRPSFRT
ncbi:MAG TPA: hypothetical protein VE093_35145 [Polyangiaceae bacterium]|nr:hypothetical protein [Polyangiaceae bacterium]